MKANTNQEKVFYQIFKTSDSNWISRITTNEILVKLPKINEFELIDHINTLQEEGVIKKVDEGWLIQYTNQRLY